jgi:hypothetical protein
MAIKQLSVFVENKKGSLADICKSLSNAGVDMMAMSLADTQDFGILRVIVDDVDKALSIMRESDCIATVTDVVGVVIPNVPGGMSLILDILRRADINIEYLYAFVGTNGKDARVVLRVADNAGAEKVLSDSGIIII